MSSKRLFAGLAAAVLVAASPAMAGVQHRCEREARGPNNSAVSVALYVDESGPITRTAATWTPPSPLSGTENAILGLLYNHSSQSGLGYSTSAIAVFSTGQSVDLEGAVAVVQVGNRSWSTRAYGEPSQGGQTFVTAVLGRFEEEAPAQPGGRPFPAFNSDLLPALDSASTVTLTLRDAGGRALLTRTFDLTSRPQRDQMFGQAWRAVGEAAREPRRCPVLED